MSARDDAHLGDVQLDDYADGTLDPAARTTAERHLASCERCRRVVDETRAVVTWARSARTSAGAPPELWPLVAASTIHLGLVRRRVLASMRGMLVVAALALVAATAVVTWQVARWTSAPRSIAVPRDVAPPSARVHRSGGHPTVPVAPPAPEPPKPPRGPRP